MIAWTIYITFGAAILLLLAPARAARWIALAAAVVSCAIGLVELFNPAANFADLTTVVRIPWVPTLGMNYHIAVDGISLTMVVVTGLTAISAVLFSWEVQERRNEFFFWLLLVIGSSYGVFLSAD